QSPATPLTHLGHTRLPQHRGSHHSPQDTKEPPQPLAATSSRPRAPISKLDEASSPCESACLSAARFWGEVVLKPGMRWRPPMEIVPLGPGFAAELRGVTIHDVAASGAAYAAVRSAFEEHSVLVLRDQDVTDEAQLAFSRRFGPLEVTKVGAA